MAKTADCSIWSDKNPYRVDGFIFFHLKVIYLSESFAHAKITSLYGQKWEKGRVPDKLRKITQNYLRYFFIKSYVLPPVRIVSMRRF